MEKDTRLRNVNVVVRGQVKSENSSLPVAVRVSKMPVLKLPIDNEFLHNIVKVVCGSTLGVYCAGKPIIRAVLGGLFGKKVYVVHLFGIHHHSECWVICFGEGCPIHPTRVDSSLVFAIRLCN